MTEKTVFSYFLLLILLAKGSNAEESTSTIFPAIISFGDSAMDVGNNNNRSTRFKANYPPYGKDFISHKPTGRFCNGKLATDITAEYLGFKSYPAAYLSREASGKKLLMGANFASAAAGYDEKASLLNHAITLTQQLDLYKEYQMKLAKVAGKKKAESIIKDALYLVGCGTADYTQNYYINSAVRKRFSPHQYSSFLVASFSRFIQKLYGLGARKIGVTSLPPLGCVPSALSLFGHKQEGCVRTINGDIQIFNNKLNSSASLLRKKLPSLKLVIFDIYTPLYNAILSPSKHGFEEVRRGCCEAEKFVLCDRAAVVCSNATKYVFWDRVHPSEAANQILADALLLQGSALL